LLVVDNVFGAIEVVGCGGNELRITARKRIRARSEEKADVAEREVSLEMSSDTGVIELYVDGPFRQQNDRSINWRGFRREGYKVIYDFEIEVPRECAVELTTVDDGDVVVTALDGNFDVNNVQGAIEIRSSRGAGYVHAVNGEVEIEFEENPRENCAIKTINGEVRLHFLRDLSADFYMKTMNGELFTDFEVAHIPGRSFQNRSGGSKQLYEIEHMSGVRVGQGGPEIELNTLNGNMFILSK